jgi:hypothetical protein
VCLLVHDDSCIGNLRVDIERVTARRQSRTRPHTVSCLSSRLPVPANMVQYIWYKMNLREPDNILVGPSKSLPSRVPVINISAAFNSLLDAIETPKWPHFCQPSKERRVFRLLLGLDIYFHLFIDAR